MTDTADNGWHLDKRVPIAIIILVFMQAFSGATLIIRMDARVSHLEQQDIENKKVNRIVYEMNADIRNIKDSLRRIENAVTVNGQH